ncbi:MAG: hypothetical protein LLG13_05110 [Bacteroidales bacterium]|nr:hypothetical protein [Bacteroidales bacterium]
MKKLNKLQINSGKIMKNEELITLRGGYGTWSCTVQCEGYSESNFSLSSNCGGWDSWCVEGECESYFGMAFGGCDCSCSRPAWV